MTFKSPRASSGLRTEFPEEIGCRDVSRGLLFRIIVRYPLHYMATRFSYSILFVGDMQRSIAFYRDLVGLKLKMESPEWTEFETEGCTLALHKASTDVEGLAAPEAGRFPAGHAHTGFTVDDIEAFAAKMHECGVACLSEVKRQEFGGLMGVWRDPDGIPVSVLSFQ